jgi:NTE family protein
MANSLTLVLSSGFFGFYAHAGVLEALCRADLRPKVICGSSAGALIGGCYAAGLEPDALRDLLFGLRREAFWDPAPGAGLLRGERLHRYLVDRLPVATFERARAQLRVSAWDVVDRRTLVLEHGNLVTAMRASAAFPGLFQPVRWGGRRLLDGGISDRSGIAGLRAGERPLVHWLESSSPWRRNGGRPAAWPASIAPENVMALGAFERLGPFRLEQGPAVYAEAMKRADRWLVEHRVTVDTLLRDAEA